jgi:hypothetical protein
MDTMGLDLHKREGQFCILTEARGIIERRIVTSRERFTAVPPNAKAHLRASQLKASDASHP